MTPTEHNLLTLTTALDIHRANPSKPLPQCVDSARMMLNFCRIECTADEPPPAEPAATLEDRVKDWVITRIGKAHMQSSERTMRLVEEAVELAQAEGIPRDMVRLQADHVYARPVGDPAQEAAGVAVCLLGWCAANNCTLSDLAAREIERIEAKPIDQIRGSLARKSDADLVVAVDAPAEPAATEPDYRGLLRDLVAAVQRHHHDMPHWSDEEKRRYAASVAAVRP